MVVLFGIPPAVAKGTSLAVIVPTALMGTWRNRRHGHADLPVALVVGLAGIVSAFAASKISVGMSETTSNVLFALLLLVVAARMVWRIVRHGAPGRPEPPGEGGAPVPRHRAS
jgi:uncharacterized membrane protein YfcA